jgi:esterase/lipase superfamily enzyme
MALVAADPAATLAAPERQPMFLLGVDGPLPGLRGADGRVVGAAAVDVSIPPNHRVGRIEYDPGGDPRRGFAIAAAAMLDGPEHLARAVLAELDANEAAVVFVHGYNNTAAEALFRHAQIVHDLHGADGGPQVTFRWPSAARAFGYLADRDAVLAARDDLTGLLDDLTAAAPGQAVVVAHSMGAFLAMEALGRMAAARPGSVRRLRAVLLISPDISLPVFLSQLDAIGHRPNPFVVTTSQANRVLDLSARLAGQAERLGTLADARRLRGLGIEVLDLTAHASEGNAHLLAVTSPAALALVRGLAGIPDRSGRPVGGAPSKGEAVPDARR